MREIKFRAWDTRIKKLWQVEELSWCDPCFIVANPSLEYMDVQDRDFRTKRCPDDIKLMQYTGLKDKNSKEIYEGDILQWCNTTIVKTKWVVESTNGGWYPFIEQMLTNRPSGFEVIGNIYENPELLKADNV